MIQDLRKTDKLYINVKNQPKQRTFRELVSLLESYGFIVNKSSGKGSHCPVYHSKYHDLRWTLSRRKPMSIFHAKKVIDLVEEVMEREESS